MFMDMDSAELRALYDRLRERQEAVMEQLTAIGDYEPKVERLDETYNKLEVQLDAIVDELRERGAPYWTDEDEEGWWT